jgi:hypothetical protein
VRQQNLTWTTAKADDTTQIYTWIGQAQGGVADIEFSRAIQQLAFNQWAVSYSPALQSDIRNNIAHWLGVEPPLPTKPVQTAEPFKQTPNTLSTIRGPFVSAAPPLVSSRVLIATRPTVHLGLKAKASKKLPRAKHKKLHRSPKSGHSQSQSHSQLELNVSLNLSGPVQLRWFFHLPALAGSLAGQGPTSPSASDRGAARHGKSDEKIGAPAGMPPSSSIGSTSSSSSSSASSPSSTTTAVTSLTENDDSSKTSGAVQSTRSAPRHLAPLTGWPVPTHPGWLTSGTTGFAPPLGGSGPLFLTPGSSKFAAPAHFGPHVQTPALGPPVTFLDPFERPG